MQVEVRADERGRFGLGRDVTRPFKDVLDRVMAGDERLYMTTQEILLDEEDRPALCSSPVSELLEAGEFELRPPMMGINPNFTARVFKYISWPNVLDAVC